ncbi:hypothetical protein Q8A67_024493 [Cirrhinus molitorella]|uniref:Uncharacterized protein n=1 Tax=Cirrhinus molitorella TaxID=172907 RepID=A0AA88P4D0_9TELE|nr:hypothetical protein Q8A67_024493 [Cirrhinus molitorella]
MSRLHPQRASEEKVNSPGLEVSPLKSKLQEKTEQSQQLQDQILKQQEALSRASQTLKDTRKAAGNKWHQQVERQTWWNHRRRVNQLQGGQAILQRVEIEGEEFPGSTGGDGGGNITANLLQGVLKQ